MRRSRYLRYFKACRDCSQTSIKRKGITMKYNLKAIMLRAWKNYRKNTELSFGECLHRAWLSEKAKEINEQRIEDAKQAAGITEDTNTWNGWKQLGYEVIHGSKALFCTSLIWGSKGDNRTYKASFFGSSQVRPVAE